MVALFAHSPWWDTTTHAPSQPFLVDSPIEINHTRLLPQCDLDYGIPLSHHSHAATWRRQPSYDMPDWTPSISREPYDATPGPFIHPIWLSRRADALPAHSGHPEGGDLGLVFERPGRLSCPSHSNEYGGRRPLVAWGHVLPNLKIGQGFVHRCCIKRAASDGRRMELG